MGERLRVLVVEDDVLDAELLLRGLKRNGYAPESTLVESPEDLSAALAAGSWDLVIADNSMPRFSGLMVLEHLRSAEPALPVIIVSGTVSGEAARALLDAGAHDVVTKGDASALLGAVRRAKAATAEGQSF